MYQDDFNTAVVEEQKDIDESYELPENVTAEPRNEEEAHLDKFKNDQAVIRTYLKVSDDYGELLGDKDLETEVIECCKQYIDVKPKDIEEPETKLQQLVDLSNRYVRRVNNAENISIGINTKYRIREGMLFNIQKMIVKKVLKRKWKEWFNENYDSSLLRSVQDYMRLARIPGVIKYAVFGKEQLLEIDRQIDNPEGEDPIGDFLANKGIEFDPEAEVDVGELKIQTDIAINREKLDSAGLEEVADDKVEALARKGIHLTKGHLRNLSLTKDTIGDLPGYIDRIIEADGKAEPILTAEIKAERYKKTVERFLDETDTALTDDHYLAEVNAEIIQRIKEKIRQLEQKLSSPAN
jgi:hypothetical protein